MSIENPTGLMPGTLLALQHSGLITTLAQVTRETNTRLYVKDIHVVDLSPDSGYYYGHKTDLEYYLSKSNAANQSSYDSLATKLFCVVGTEDDFASLAAASKQHWINRTTLEERVAADREAAERDYAKAVEGYVEELNGLLEVELDADPSAGFGGGMDFTLRFASFTDTGEGVRPKWRKFDPSGATVHRPAPPASTIEQEPTRDASDLFSMAQPG